MHHQKHNCKVGLLNIYVGLKQHNKVWPAFIVMILVIPEAGAKLERLFNKSASGAKQWLDSTPWFQNE